MVGLVLECPDGSPDALVTCLVTDDLVSLSYFFKAAFEGN